MPLDNFGIVVPDRLYRCGQPDAKGYADLQTLGVTQVMKLNGDGQADGEAAAVGALGMTFATYDMGPLGGLLITPKMLRDVAVHLDAWDGCVTAVHCTHGRDRTGAVIAAWRILYCGYSFEAADAERHLYGTALILDDVDALIVAALKDLKP